MVGFSAGNSGFGYVVAVDGLSALRDIETLPKAVVQAAYRAINKTADRSRTDAARRIREQVAFPVSYLAPSGERLTVTDRATSDKLEARITGRFRPTSLARFVTSASKGKGVTLEVAPGMAKRSRRMFVVRLRAGTADLDTKSNLGLAIRLKPGERVEHKYKTTQMKNGLTLLYGPAVSQVFSTVAEDVSPDAADFLEQEFLRLMELN